LKKFLKAKLWRIPLIAIVALSLVLVGGGAALAVTYTLDETIPATVTVAIPEPPTDANLYTDLECTIPWSGTMDFGTLTAAGQTSTKFLYFKANRSTSVPGGYGFGEIDPASVVVTSDIDPLVATFMSIVGEPFGAVIAGNHPCMITFSVIAVGNGTTNYNIHVTGND